jgi:hypothetical protein
MPESEITDAAMLAAGRALYVCNQFEAKCRIVLRNMQIIDRIASDPVASLAETFNGLPSSPKMLGGTLEKIRAKAEAFGVTEAQLQALVKAKGCGSTGVSWLRCEDEVIAVFDVVDALVLLA